MTKEGSEGIPIVQRSYDLCVGLYRHVDRFPRAQRGLLGRVILDDALQMLTLLTVATRRNPRAAALEEASGLLDALRIALRLGKRLGFLSNGGYEELSDAADEVGRMLGGWLKHEMEAPENVSQRGRRAGTPAPLGIGGPSAIPVARVETPAPPGIRESSAILVARASPPARTGGVRYTMTSPSIERYLRLKLAHPQAIVFVTSGAFCQTFFEDAVACGQALRLAVRNVAAESEAEKILTCGIPRANLERYIALLREAGRDMHVE